MDEEGSAPRRSPLGGTTLIIQFLSLYLLVLAFFILLVSISTPEKVKSNAVMDSLNSTFAAILPPSTELTIFTERSGRILSGQEFQQQVNGLFATALAVTKVEVIQPGRLMRVEMEADGLFVPGDAAIRESQIPLLDRVVASLSGRPPGTHFDIEFVLGSEYVEETDLPTGNTLNMARAGAFAREMLSRGAPPDSIAVGFRHGDPNQIVMWFFVRPEGEITELIERLVAPKDAAPPPAEVE